MNDTKSYILSVRESLPERLAVGFIVYLILFILSCGISYALSSIFRYSGYFIAVSPLGSGGTVHLILSVAQCAIPSVVALILIYLSAHTIFSHVASGAVILWRGTSLGCAGSLMGSGTVISIGRYWTVALTLYFLSSVMIILLAAYSYIYSLCLCRAHSSGDVKLCASVAAEYLRLFMMFSGCIFVCACVTVLLT